MESEIKLPKKGIVGVELENLNEFLTELSIR